jgi:deoxyribodipyrimidine photolyase
MSEFERYFSDFIDKREYDEAENMLFLIVRAAFLSGWLAAGGIDPKNTNTLQIIKSKRENGPPN